MLVVVVDTNELLLQAFERAGAANRVQIVPARSRPEAIDALVRNPDAAIVEATFGVELAMQFALFPCNPMGVVVYTWRELGDREQALLYAADVPVFTKPQSYETVLASARIAHQRRLDPALRLMGFNLAVRAFESVQGALDDRLDWMRKGAVLRALAKTGGNISDAATLLGVNRCYVQRTGSIVLPDALGFAP